jgi:Fe-S cluster assembly protein SufD
MTALPTPKMERWKYSNLHAFVKGEYDEQPLSVGYDGDDTFVTPYETDMTPWAQADYNDMDLWADMQDVLSIKIPEGNHVSAPVKIAIHNENGQKSIGAIHVHLGQNAKATLYDTIECEGWLNRSLTITLDEGAELIHVRTGGGTGILTSLIQIDQAAGSKYNAYALNNYGTFVRDQIHARLNGEKAECFLSGAKLLKNKNHCDTCILIEHLAPNCHSNQNYRNILDNASRGVFQGKVHVHRVAQQTDGYQLCNSILLSDKCEMDTKPELEIYADDVKCSHGAVTAQMDAEPLFYMMARGIPKDLAEKMMMHAFVAESLDALSKEEDVYERLANTITSILNA